MDNSESVIPLLSRIVPGISIMRKQRRPNRSTPQSAHEPEFLSVELLDHSQSVKEETQEIGFIQQNIESCDLNRKLYSTSLDGEIIFISENNEFVVSNEHDNNIPVKRDNGDYIDNSQQSNKIEIIVEEESGDDFRLTDDIHDENWPFLNAKTELVCPHEHSKKKKKLWIKSNLLSGILFRNVDDNLKAYGSSNVHSMIVPEEFENDCSESLFGASGDNSETASTHYLKVEPLIDALTYDTTKIR